MVQFEEMTEEGCVSSLEILAHNPERLSVESALLLPKSPLSFKYLCFIWEVTPVERVTEHPIKPINSLTAGGEQCVGR